MSEENNNENTGLAVRQQETALMQPQSFDLIKAQLDAELETNLRQLSVTEFTSPTSLLPNDKPLARSLPFSMLDCFEFEIQEKGVPKTIVIYVCDFGGETGIKTVAQSITGSREKWVNTFMSARVAKKQLTLTNLVFTRLDKGKKAGNFPIIVTYTKDSKHFLTDVS